MSKAYLDRIKEIVTINDPHSKAADVIWDILNTSQAIIFDGHFELLSTRHTDKFFRFAAITQYPYYVSKISQEMVKWIETIEISKQIDVVLSPASQGMFFAYDIARELNGRMKTRAVYTAIDKETGYPQGSYIEGFEISRGENVLIVNDLTTTGSGIETLINTAEASGANIVGICLFASRGIGEKKIETITKTFKYFHSIITLDMPSWDKKDCESKCLKGKILIKAKQINHLPIYTGEDVYDRYVKKLQAA
jgi:orotate phosphoribosyltransferase